MPRTRTRRPTFLPLPRLDYTSLDDQLAVIAERCGRSTRTVERWFERRQVPYKAADGFACAVGDHPASLWDEWEDPEVDPFDVWYNDDDDDYSDLIPGAGAA